MTKHAIAVAAVLVACGGTTAVAPPPPKPIVVEPPKLDPACPQPGTIALPDGHLRCRELPFEIAFPPNTQLSRSNEGNMALFSAVLEHGVLAVVVEPRTDEPDRQRITELLASLILGIAPDAKPSPLPAPRLDGATASAALSFATPDGGAGLVRGYYAHHWLFAVMVGGRLPTTPTRPGSPIAESFLASLHTRPLPTTNVLFALTGGAHLSIPASAWSTGAVPAQPGVRSETFLRVPDRAVWIGVRELDAFDRCAYIRDATTDLADRFKSVYAGSQYPLHDIERAKHGDVSVYAQTEADTRHVAMLFVCRGKTVLQLSVVGEQPQSELRPYLDELAKSFVGAL